MKFRFKPLARVQYIIRDGLASFRSSTIYENSYEMRKEAGVLAKRDSYYSVWQKTITTQYSPVAYYMQADSGLITSFSLRFFLL